MDTHKSNKFFALSAFMCPPNPSLLPIPIFDDEDNTILNNKNSVESKEKMQMASMKIKSMLGIK